MMQNKLGIFYTYYPFTGQVEWERCIQRAALAGADSIEVSAMRLVRENPTIQETVTYTAKKFGLALSFTSGLPEGCDTSSEDPDERARALTFIRDNLKLVQRMGGSQISAVWHGRSHPGTGRLNCREKRLEYAAETLREAGKIAADIGIVLCDEPVNRFEHEMINTVKEELKFLTLVDSPGVKATLDTFHMNIEEDNIVTAIHSASGYIGHIHLSENNRKLPGFGHLDWQAILQAIGESGYTSFLTMECFTTPYPAISESMSIWRNMSSQGIDADVSAAISFLKNRMKQF